MSTISQPPSQPPRRPTSGRDMWAGIAISVMWVAVAVVALFGPDIVSTSPGPTSSTVPSAVVLALFASLASWLVAKYGFGRHDD